jgi:hypothetical protein
MGDLHAGNLLVASNNELVAIDPTPALGVAQAFLIRRARLGDGRSCV